MGYIVRTSFLSQLSMTDAKNTSTKKPTPISLKKKQWVRLKTLAS